MLILIITLFGIAALLGIYLLSFVLQNKNTPKGIALLHGPVAAVALAILIIYAFLHTYSPIISIILFILVAIGGGILIYRDLMGKTMPKWLALGHGILALIAFLFLLVFTFLFA